MNWNLFHFLFYNLQDGRTPLHICCIKGKVEIVKLLIEHGANATAKDNVRGTCEVVLEHSEILSKQLPTLEKPFTIYRFTYTAK